MSHLTGMVSRIRHVYDGSNTLFYLMLKGGGDRIYTGMMSQNANYVMTQPGDRVCIAFERSARQQVINILRFHNLTLRPAQ